MKQKKLLFIESTSGILKKIRLDFAHSRIDCSVVAVNGAQAAMKLLDQRDFDLIIANIEGDVETWGDLFLALRHRSPSTFRMALSQTPTESCANSVKFAHGCISETLGFSQISAAISRGLEMGKQLKENRRLSLFTDNLHTLPTPPSIYFATRDILDSPDGDLQKAADSIAKDPALTAKILKVANSGFYALPRTVADLKQAISLIGLETVLSVVLAAHLFDRLPLPGYDLDKLWIHCVTVSTLAREIAKERGGNRETVNASGVAGLLHDIGGLIFVSNAPNEYFSLLRNCRDDEAELERMEREQFGIGHPDLGAFVLALWGLPQTVVDAVALHHCLGDRVASTASLPSKAVFAAEWLVSSLMAPEFDLCVESVGSRAEVQEPHFVTACRGVFDRFMERPALC